MIQPLDYVLGVMPNDCLFAVWVIVVGVITRNASILDTLKPVIKVIAVFLRLV